MLPELISVTAGDATIGVSPDGAQLLTWTIAEREFIFVSSTSGFGPGVSARGGIPICFPWFGRKAEPSHGLVRTTRWAVEAVSDTSIRATTSFTDGNGPSGYLTDASIEVTFTLTDRSLRMEVRVTNDGEDPGQFDLALHTYYAVSDVSHVKISGITGNYTDTGDSGSQEGLTLIPAPPLDRIYTMSAPTTIGQVVMEPHGFTNTVVWNPGADHGLTDLADGENTQFICVEPMRDGARCASLAPGDTAMLAMTLTVSE
ncbi:MAG: hypothetical protein Q4P71_05305 [Actinomycetaceae bacterium]|nr:hypothetical protein [Actinomycetaceae bacterium]